MDTSASHRASNPICGQGKYIPTVVKPYKNSYYLVSMGCYESEWIVWIVLKRVWMCLQGHLHHLNLQRYLNILYVVSIIFIARGSRTWRIFLYTSKAQENKVFKKALTNPAVFCSVEANHQPFTIEYKQLCIENIVFFPFLRFEMSKNIFFIVLGRHQRKANAYGIKPGIRRRKSKRRILFKTSFQKVFNLY